MTEINNEQTATLEQVRKENRTQDHKAATREKRYLAEQIALDYGTFSSEQYADARSIARRLREDYRSVLDEVSMGALAHALDLMDREGPCEQLMFTAKRLGQAIGVFR